MKQKNAQTRLMEEVIKTYDAISTDFDATRRTMWPEFVVLKEKMQNAGVSRILDSGCGNGRVAHLMADLPLDYFGYDGSKKLVAQAKKWWKTESNPLLKAHFSVGTLITKKYTKPFEVIVSSAVAHHLPTHELQLKYLKKLANLLTPDGFLYISVWNLWQEKYVPFIDPKTHGSFIPWGTEKKKRFYYAFEKEELRKLLTQAGFVTLEEVPSTHNFCYIAWKK